MDGFSEEFIDINILPLISLYISSEEGNRE
jgi:hypothetical protein